MPFLLLDNLRENRSVPLVKSGSAYFKNSRRTPACLWAHWLQITVPEGALAHLTPRQVPSPLSQADAQPPKLPSRRRQSVLSWSVSQYFLYSYIALVTLCCTHVWICLSLQNVSSLREGKDFISLIVVNCIAQPLGPCEKAHTEPQPSKAHTPEHTVVGTHGWRML